MKLIVLFLLALMPILYAATERQQVLQEQDVIDLMPYINIDNIVNAKNQLAVHNWVLRQTDLTLGNKKTLLNLAFGLDPKTGMKSGFVSVKAIEFVMSNLQDGITKDALTWMFDVLKDVKTGVEEWALPKNGDRLSAIIRDYPLLSLAVFSYVDKWKMVKPKPTGAFLDVFKRLESRYDNLINRINREREMILNEINANSPKEGFSQRLKQYGSNNNYEEIGDLTRTGHYTFDLNLNNILDGQKHEVAALYYRLARICGSYHRLGFLIDQEKIMTNSEGQQFTDKDNRYEDAAKCYRLSKIGDAYYNLALLIAQEKIKTNSEGQQFIDKDKDEEVAKCYRLSKTADAYNNLGLLIAQEKIMTNNEGNQLEKDNRYEEAAKCYRLSKLAAAYYNLALLIAQEKIKTNSEGQQFIDKDNRYEEVAKCYRLSKTAEAYHNLGLLISQEKINTNSEGSQLEKDNRYEEAAKCFRLSKTFDSYYALGLLIHEGKIRTNNEGSQLEKDNRYEEAAKCYRLSKNPEAYHNLGVLIYFGEINTNGDGNQLDKDNRYEEAVKCFRLSKKPIAVLNLSKLYIEYDFGLTNEERLKKIESILENLEDVQKYSVLAQAYQVLNPFNFEKIKSLWEIALKKRIPSSFLDMIPEEESIASPSLSDDESEDTSPNISKRLSRDKKNLSFDEILNILDAERADKLREIEENENKNFESIIKRFNIGIEKQRIALENMRRRIDLIRKNIKPRMESDDVEYKLQFTKKAYDNFKDLDKAGKERFKRLVEAIKSNDKTGDVEMLTHEDLVDGRPVITRRLTEADRFAYTLDEKEKAVYVLSLKDHYKA